MNELLKFYSRTRSNLQPYLSKRWGAHYILPNLILGNLASSCNEKALKEHGVTHVLCCVINVKPYFPKSFQYYNIALLDIKVKIFNFVFSTKLNFIVSSKTQDIFSYFEQAIEWIDKALESPKSVVYVHCIEGRSRSATIVCAYLMHKFGLNTEEALKMVKEKRAVINPNAGFR